MDSEQDNTTVDDSTDLMTSGAASAGDRLRSAREKQQMDLAHIAAVTRIPVRHLAAIEAGNFAELPSRAYAIGFSRSFARVVGLDEKSITEAVREELSDGYARTSAMAGGMEPGDPAKLPSAGLAWFGGFAALLLAVGIIAFFSSYFSAGSGLPSLIADEAVEGVGDGTGQDAALAEAGNGDGSGDGSADGGEAAAAAPSGGEVVFTALEDGIWVRVYEDGGERLFEAEMASGDRFALPSDAVEPRINTGRPDALAITIGGRDVPKLSDAPVTLGDTPISASALLARADAPQTATANN